MNGGINLTKLATHLAPHKRTSSPVIASELIPAEGEVADETVTLLIPLKNAADYSGRVLAPTVAAPRSCMN
jgi:hypothetical protein